MAFLLKILKTRPQHVSRSENLSANILPAAFSRAVIAKCPMLWTEGGRFRTFVIFIAVHLYTGEIHYFY